MTTDTDHIRKTAKLKAPPARVWHAITDARQFGHWFGMDLDGPFRAGTRVTGRIAPTRVDADVAKMQEPYAGTPFELFVEAIEPMRRFSFRWHPYAVGAADHAQEPTTLVEFVLDPIDDGTELTITESGFDAIPLARRAQAFAANEQGWTHQLRLIARYLDQPEQAG